MNLFDEPITYCHPNKRHSSVEKRVIREEKGSGNWLLGLLGLLALLFLIGLLIAAWNKNYQKDKSRTVIALTSTDARPRGTSQNSKASLTIDNVQVHPLGQEKGWINVAGFNQTIDLLNLKNDSNKAPHIIADTWLPYGQYDGIRFNIVKVNISDEKENKLTYSPSNVVEIPSHFTVKKDGVTTIVLDISLNNSLYDATEKGKAVKVFAPYFDYETRDDADVTTALKRLTIRKPGHLVSKGTAAMDIAGRMEKALAIPHNVPLSVNNGKISFGSSDKFYPSNRNIDGSLLGDQQPGLDYSDEQPLTHKLLPLFYQGAVNRS